MTERSKTLTEAELLQQVGFWYTYFEEVKANLLQIQSLQAQGLIGLRRHKRDKDDQVVDAYELTDAGIDRLRVVTNARIAEIARLQREYLRDQARKNNVV